MSFRPDPAAPAARPAWLTLLSGGLRLEGIDVVVPADAAPKAAGLVAFAVGAGADLSLIDCTVTVEGSRPKNAVLRLVAPGAAAAPVAVPGTIRLKNCLARSGGDLIDVDPDQPLGLELDNVAVAAAGGLLHGHGGPKGEEARTLKAALRQVSARVPGGVVLLDSTPGSPELPFAEVVARDSIFATNAQGDPLVRLEGQDDPDALRGRVHWDGNNVAYHRISTYRRDRTRRLGSAPTLFDRASWEVAVGPREASAIHDDLKFAKEWDAARPSWSLEPDDLRLRADSPAVRAGSGSDLIHIPSPPVVED